MSNTATTTIEAGQTLTARSACDQDCVFRIQIVSRKGMWAVVRDGNETKRCKVHANHEGMEGVFAYGRYSMAPFFRADSAE